MSDILCVYYSRTGKTRAAAMEVAEALGAETLELRDRVERRGLSGALRCGIDAMRRSTAVLEPVEPQHPLGSYRLVILCTPVWAGRCSSVMRAFLKRYGKKLQRCAYLITRGCENRSEEVYEQMDLYVPCGHCAAVSLRSGSVGYAFWREDFLRQVRDLLNAQ